ncbi:TnsA endonuclease N-terminal domain-containing protein [Roseateles noduli]|uniref:TnsA endonuclease N-terminal domain-containing protein n=1 Tax=Roseateles noduli TaxID=2052484 RepID=UPI003D651216
MKRRVSRAWTLTKIAFRIRHGYGQGELAAYIPWIGVRDLSSKGTSTRMWSPKTGRTMQFLSNIERDTFLIAEFREDFVDYWEQWPLDRNWTQWAAARLGRRHPIYIGGHLPVVMTVDGVLTLRHGEGVVRKAIDCKNVTALENARTLEKLAITRLTLERLGLPHLLVTEEQTPPQVVKNILWVRLATRKSLEIEPVPGAFDMWPMRMHRHLRLHGTEPQFASMPLNKYCQWFEAQHNLPRGLGLRFMKLLMWQHLVEFDLTVRAPETRPLRSLQLKAAPRFSAKSTLAGA